MPALDLTPDTLDTQAAALLETAAWQRIVEGWHHTATEPIDTAIDTAQHRPTGLLTKTVDELVDEALRALPAAPPAERPLPGRLGAILPDHAHAWRRIGQTDVRPSVQLDYAARVLKEWGWQNKPYRLRDHRGARCICGALIAAHRLGYGSRTTLEQSGAWLLTELRHRGWHDLVGPWNRAPGRTADQAIDLITAAARRAAHVGH